MTKKKDKWVDREKPNIDHLLGLYRDEPLPAFIIGHLVVEAVLVQLIDIKLKEPDKFDSFSISFPQKVNLCMSLGLFGEPIGEFLIHLNSLRNKFAHRLGFQFTFDNAFELVNKAAKAGIDFSDDEIFLDKDFSRDSYGIGGVLQEVFSNTAQDLAFILEENGGEFLFG